MPPKQLTAMVESMRLSRHPCSPHVLSIAKKNVHPMMVTDSRPHNRKACQNYSLAPESSGTKPSDTQATPLRRETGVRKGRQKSTR